MIRILSAFVSFIVLPSCSSSVLRWVFLLLIFMSSSVCVVLGIAMVFFLCSIFKVIVSSSSM